MEATGAWSEHISRFVDQEWSAVMSENPMIQVGSMRYAEVSRRGRRRPEPYPPRRAKTARIVGSRKAEFKWEARWESEPPSKSAEPAN